MVERVQHTRCNLTPVLLEGDDKVLIFDHFDNCLLCLRFDFAAAGLLRSQPLAEIHNCFLSVTVKYDALDLLADFIFLVGISLLLVDNEPGQLRTIFNRKDQAIFLLHLDCCCDFHTHMDLITLQGQVGHFSQRDQLRLAILA